MSVRTICFTGMDRTEEAALTAMFASANAALGEPVTLAAETEADVVIVDMDTIYGHMSWLRAHGRGQRVVALSGRSHAETDLNLLRPVDEARMSALLGSLLGDPTQAAESPHASDPDEAMPATSTAPESKLDDPGDAGENADDGLETHLPESTAVEPTAEAGVATGTEPPPASADRRREQRLLDVLFPGALRQPARVALNGHPMIAIDPAAQRWYGPTALKSLIPLAREPLSDADLAPASPADLSEAGESQPLSRLVWLAALAAGEGGLLGFAPETRFKLAKWPQTEREFPRHLRIGTALMKAPATVAEVAQASGASEADVADFINASLATGFAEPASAAPGSIGKDGRLGHLPPRNDH